MVLRDHCISKTLRHAMKITAFILFAACMQVSATGVGQTITLSKQNASLVSVFTEIEKQSGYHFLFTYELVEKEGTVNIDVKNVSLEQALDNCLQGKDISYAVVEKTVVIKPKMEGANKKVTEPPPPVDIAGRVTNNNGEPLAGANIIIKRTGHGTVADANGKFTLKNVNSTDEIIVSFVGYKKQAINVGTITNFNLVMEATTNELDKVVVQAYGTTSQRLATGNIGVVRAEDIAKQPVMNVLQAIQGQVPGVVVTNTSGYASGTVKVEIRGRNTINPNFPTDPLYIIDGVPLTILDVSGVSSYETGSAGAAQAFSAPSVGQSPFFNINPADIESINILKDADATAIYGSRGANGVVIITTKKGAAGKSRFDVNLYEGITKVTQTYKLLNTQEYVDLRKEALANDGITPDIYNAPDLTAWDTTRYTDWQKFLWSGTGKTTDAEASLSGGDGHTTFRIGAGYTYLSDIIAIKGGNQRGNLSFNINHKSINQKFSIGLSGMYSASSTNSIFLPTAALLPPNAPAVYDSTNHLNYTGWAPVQYFYPFSTLRQSYDSKTNLLNSSLVVGYEILKGLGLKVNLGYNSLTANQVNRQPIISQDPEFSPKGSATFGFTSLHNLIVEPQLEYNSFIGKGKFDVLIGGSGQKTVTDAILLIGYGYNSDLLLDNINNAPSKLSFDHNGQYRYAAIFGRINYNWNNKYIVNFNTRRDGSSRFGPGRQFGTFWSIGTAYVFSEEKWIKEKIPFVSFGKLRASYGSTGSDQIPDYRYLSLWSSEGYYSYNGLVPIVPQGHSDSLLQWEVNKKLEVALNIGLLHDRISLEVAWYRNRCNDQLIQFATPAFTGFSSVVSNSVANVQNTGWEFIVNANAIDNKTFHWNIKTNIGINRNKLLSYPNLSQSPYAGYFIVGKPLNIKKVLHYTGVDSQTGLYTFEDKNHDGQITTDLSGKTADDTYALNIAPVFDGGFTNVMSFANWEISLFIYFKKQMGFSANGASQIPGGIYNVSADAIHHWKKPGDNAPIAKLTTQPYNDQSYSNYQFFSDAVYSDASFIRLKNVMLSYNVKNERFNKSGIKSLKLYFKAENLFLITHYKGVDPETQAFGTLPTPKIITMGISCTF